VVQFAEAEGHPHVHVHIIPRMADQPDDYRGPGIFQMLGVPEAEQVSAESMNALALEVRRYLATSA
jgi:diadenosine tetraphosphate (Ap4A) HIT family hydrolase